MEKFIEIKNISIRVKSKKIVMKMEIVNIKRNIQMEVEYIIGDWIYIINI